MNTNAESTLETLAYCGGLDYRDDDSHHIRKHPDHFTAECAECSSRLAFAHRVAALSSSQERILKIIRRKADEAYKERAFGVSDALHEIARDLEAK